MPEREGIFYKDEGKGFPVLLIHGFCETHEIWNSFSKIIAKEFRIISIDLPGCGKSKPLNAPFSIRDVAIKLLNFLSALEINSCIVVGHSLGGYVTLAMTNEKPDCIKAFSLFHSTAYPDSEEKKFSRNKVIEFVSEHGVKPFIESFIPPLFYDKSNVNIPSVINIAMSTSRETLINYVKAMRDRPDRTNVLKSYNGSILLIAGEMDGVISPEALREQSKMSSQSKMVLMKDVAHMGMFENELLAADQMLQFLRAETVVA